MQKRRVYDTARESGIEVEDIAGQKISQGDVRAILMDGTSSGSAEVCFLGTDRQQYRAVWQVKRARERSNGKLQADSVHLENLETKSFFPGKKTETLAEITRLTALNFDQFTRSVLLAQGDFTAFLKADKDSKASLLEKLTGTRIYSEISTMIFNKCRDATSALRELTVQMEGITLLSEGEKENLLTQKENLQTEIAAKKRDIDLVQSQMRWYQDLRRLQKEKTDADSFLREISETWQSLEGERSIWQQIEDAREIKPSWERRSHALSEKKAALEKAGLFQQDIDRIQNKITAAKAELGLKDDLSVRLQKEQEDGEPLIREARRLNVVLKEKLQQCELAAKDRDGAVHLYKSRSSDLQTRRSEIKALDGDASELKKWLHENQSREPLAENFALIRSKLRDAEHALSTVSELKEKVADCEQKRETHAKLHLEYQRELQDAQISLTELEKQFAAQKEKISDADLQKLLDEKDLLARRHRELISAKGCWEKFLTRQEEMNALGREMADIRKELAAKKSELDLNASLLLTAKVQKEQAEKLLAGAKMQTAENVESLRSQLVSGEACPVCGSFDHPFATRNPRSMLVLQALEDAVAESSGSYEKALRKKSELDGSIGALDNRLTRINEGSIQKEKAFELVQSEWMSVSVANECKDISEPGKLLWFEQQEREVSSSVSFVEAQIQSGRKKREEAEKLNRDIQQAQARILKVENSIENTAQAVQSATESRDNHRENLGKQETALQTLLAGLDTFFMKEGWQQNWMDNSGLFLDKVSSFASSWKQKKEMLGETERTLNAKRSAEEEVSRQVSLLLTEMDKKQAYLDERQQERDEILMQQKSILDGKNADEVESDLRHKIQKVVAEKETLREALQILENTRLEKHTALDSLSGRTDQCESVIRKEDQVIAGWLANYNDQKQARITESALEEYLDKTVPQIKEHQLRFNQVKESLTKAESLQQDRNRNLSNFLQANQPHRSEEELSQAFAAETQDIESLTQTKSRLEFNLEQDEGRIKDHGTLIRKVESSRAVCEKWSKLNDLIGSADGRKFRTIAQEYTLDILLQHANKHLQFLSSRYQLSRIPDSLALQVLDMDMGNEIRTVFSLSGGESFLVSLALALGLASLSSDKMRVESLFIDEGFGSLDPQTLDIAMDALDRLHSQGRKVGVISHVQEMKERINTQIRVEKMPGGKSRVIVVSV